MILYTFGYTWQAAHQQGEDLVQDLAGRPLPWRCVRLVEVVAVGIQSGEVARLRRGLVWALQLMSKMFRKNNGWMIGMDSFF